MKRYIFLVLGFLLSGCQNDPAAKKAKPVRPAVVTVDQVTSDSLVVQRAFLGEVWAASDAELSVGEAGRVLRVHVDEGARVKKGQLLVELDDRLARAELSEAIASQQEKAVQSGQAQRDAERYTLMRQEDIVSELEAQQQQSTAESLVAAKAGARATVQARSETVARHRLLAPFDGTITTRAVDPGDWVTPGRPVLRLLTEQRLEVLARVPASLLDQAHNLRAARIVDGGRSVKATIESTVGALDRQTRTGLLRLLTKEAPPWLRSGSTVKVLLTMEQEGSLNLPADAIVRGAVGARVLVVRKQGGHLVAEKVDVQVLAQAGARVLVEAEGLELGDRVVTRGNERLRPGQQVTWEGAIAPSGAK